MLRKISIFVLLAGLVCFGSVNVLAQGPPADPDNYEHSYGANPPVNYVISNAYNSGSFEIIRSFVTVSAVCRNKEYIRYQISGPKIIGYVDTKGSKYLIDAMFQLGYNPGQWSKGNTISLNQCIN